jgi:hypothetical protein
MFRTDRGAERLCVDGSVKSGRLKQRMIETIQSGKPATPFLKPGDRVEIEMLDAKNHSIFRRIDQEVVKG